MKNYFLAFFIVLYSFSYSQSDFDKILLGSEVLLSGLSFIKGNKSKPESKNVEYFCVKNKLSDKVTFKLTSKDEDGIEIKKELIIQKDGKECVFEIPKGVWAYEIILSNKETFKKGEFKLDDDIVITVKDD